VTAQAWLSTWNLAVRRFYVNGGNLAALRCDRFYCDAVRLLGMYPSGSY